MQAHHHTMRLQNSGLELRWIRFWMRFAGLSAFGRLASRLAAVVANPHKSRDYLARMNPKGFISPKAVVYNADFRYGKNIYIDDRVVLFQRPHGGGIELGDRVHVYRDSILETGFGGSLTIGDDSSIHPRCQLNAYISSIEIGSRVMVAPNCGFYPYDHGISPGRPITQQPLESKGSIFIGDDAWIAYGAIILSGVRIGHGAVVGAGSVVTRSIPEGSVAIGNPAKVVKLREELDIDRQ
jgi:acetyltransferase-like isoleucine patch superfamily enzyme